MNICYELDLEVIMINNLIINKIESDFNAFCAEVSTKPGFSAKNIEIELKQLIKGINERQAMVINSISKGVSDNESHNFKGYEFRNLEIPTFINKYLTYHIVSGNQFIQGPDVWTLGCISYNEEITSLDDDEFFSLYHRYRTLFRGARVLMMEWTPKGQFTYVNSGTPGMLIQYADNVYVLGESEFPFAFLNNGFLPSTKDYKVLTVANEFIFEKLTVFEV